MKKEHISLTPIQMQRKIRDAVEEMFEILDQQGAEVGKFVGRTHDGDVVSVVIVARGPDAAVIVDAIEQAERDAKAARERAEKEAQS